MEQNQIVIYKTKDGQTQIDVRLENDTVWLTQAQMAELFERTPQNITIHIGNAYREGELDKESTCKEYLQVQTEGKRKVKRSISQDLLNVVVDYTYALDTLDNYDYERLTIDKTTKQEPFHATYENAMEAISNLREKFGGSTLFGNIRTGTI